MRIKLLKPWSMNRPGDVVDFDRSVAEQLVKRGVAVPVSEPQTVSADVLPAERVAYQVNQRRTPGRGKAGRQ